MVQNFIIHQKAKQYEWYGDCFLSVKSFYDGQANYKVKQREYNVNQSNFLVLNECTKYRLTIDSLKETESFCVFFSPDFVSNFISSLKTSDEKLLDFKTKISQGFKFYERNYYHNGLVSELLKYGRIKSKLGFEDIEKEEYYHFLLQAILQQNENNFYQASLLNSKKKSTREEIYQRVLYAKDYIDSNFSKNLTLKTLAQISLLSENHLLRNFRQIFGITPFQYLSNKRITEAKNQLINTNKGIAEIATDIGYSSVSNFSFYFKTLTGKSPTAFRKSDI